jgi:hypothetical protein
VAREWRGSGEGAARERRGSGEGAAREWRGSGEGVAREWRGSDEGAGSKADVALLSRGGDLAPTAVAMGRQAGCRDLWQDQ